MKEFATIVNFRILMIAMLWREFVETLDAADQKIAVISKCKVSEFTCGNKKCVPLNYYCNNVNDCGDFSDEPRYCTRCNRTYYGTVGTTYDLELHRPKEDKIPFICHLTFTASGEEYGDLIQLTFDSFTLGRFESFTNDGCPDGALQITETNRPKVGGSWCGTTWSPAIYYSETNSVVVSVSLFRLSKDQSGYNFDFRMEYKFLRKKMAIVRYGGTNPTFQISFANTTPPLQKPPPVDSGDRYLGDLITGTYCSRIFSDCDRKHCRLQSPNFPGVYPRNLTCYYAVRQHEIPEGKHALITVRQPKGQLVYIRSQSALYGTASTKELKVWDDCNDVQDYVTVYDGYTTRDPVILKFCGGGEAVPEAVSSGHELLVEFSTSPYGTFSHPAPAQSLNGFQLEVEVKFVDQQTPTYVKQKRQCEFWLRGTNKGVLESPLHSLPANTTCLYHLQGIDTSLSASPVPFRPLAGRYPDWRHVGMVLPPARYRVWLSIVKFHVTGNRHSEKPDQELCRSYLNVWDGQLWAPSNCNDFYCGGINRERPKSSSPTRTNQMNLGKKNVTLLARYCKEHVPRSCEHSLLANGTRFPRPCNLAESYLTSGDSLTLELKLADSTALRPVKFKALYEFVDLHLDGEPYGSGVCSRKFTTAIHETNQKFMSPKDIFLYGRGGARNISCVYRFEAQKDEKIKITISNIVIKNRACITKISKETDRFECDGNSTASLRLFEVPWNDVPGVPRACFCATENEDLPFTYVSTSNVVELHFDVLGMRADDDYSTLFFQGNWKFVRTPTCEQDTRLKGANGKLEFHFPSKLPQELNCEQNPRAIVPSTSKHLYVKINGIITKHATRAGVQNKGIRTTVSSVACPTKNRIAVHTALYSALVCPFEGVAGEDRDRGLVEVFSEGWTTKGSSKDTGNLGKLALDKVEIDYLGQELSRAVIVEFIGKEEAKYSVTWLELSRRKDIPPNGQGLYMIKPDDCQYRCPELDACIDSSVWCDGLDDCPSGIDEAITHCSAILQLPPIYLFLLSLCVAATCGACAALIFRTYRRHRRPRSILQTRLKSLSSSSSAIVDGDKNGSGAAGVIC